MRTSVRRGACAGKLSAAVVVGLLLAEAGFRVLLFGESAAALRFGARLRVPSAFADADESDHWKLLRLFQPRAMRKAQRFPDPVTGWIRRPYDLASVERELAGRRPVLLFGDSYAQCTTPECFQDLLARSDLAGRYLLVNRGTAGFGLDQIWLSMEAALDDFAHLDPVVLVGVFLDNDLERTVLDFRQWPKPRCRVEGGELVVTAPEPLDPDAYLDAHPPRIASYLWRFASRRAGLGEEARRARRAALGREKQELARALLARAHRDLAERGLEHFFVLFHGPSCLARPGPAEWEESLAHDVLGELGAPFVSSRWPLTESARDWRELFDGGHYNAAGNAAVFGALHDGLNGRFEPPRFTPRTVLGLAGPVREVLGGEGAVVRFSRGPSPIVPASEGLSRFLLRPAHDGPAEVWLPLGGGVERLRARAGAVRGHPARRSCPPLLLEVVAGGETRFRAELARGVPSVEIDVDVSGLAEVGVVVSVAPGTGPVGACDVVHVSDPTLERPSE